jgi:hypothetical protein
MSDWWRVAQVSATALGSVAMCLGLRRYTRAVLWNVLLKGMGVDEAQRREIAVKAARLDLRIDGSARAGQTPQPSPGAAKPDRQRGLRRPDADQRRGRPEQLRRRVQPRGIGRRTVRTPRAGTT